MLLNPIRLAINNADLIVYFDFLPVFLFNEKLQMLQEYSLCKVREYLLPLQRGMCVVTTVWHVLKFSTILG